MSKESVYPEQYNIYLEGMVVVNRASRGKDWKEPVEPEVFDAHFNKFDAAERKTRLKTICVETVDLLHFLMVEKQDEGWEVRAERVPLERLQRNHEAFLIRKK